MVFIICCNTRMIHCISFFEFCILLNTYDILNINRILSCSKPSHLWVLSSDQLSNLILYLKTQMVILQISAILFVLDLSVYSISCLCHFYKQLKTVNISNIPWQLCDLCFWNHVCHLERTWVTWSIFVWWLLVLE